MIEELHQDTFKRNPTMRMLDVSVNRLRSLHADMFVHMTSFYFLNVSYNMLVLNGTIINSEYLSILDASYCNRMKHRSWHALEKTTFSGLPNLRQLVLEGNAIRCLKSDTFTHNLYLGELNLKNNELRVMTHEIFSQSRQLYSLIISNNPFVCDCRMKVFSKWCSNHSVTLDAVSCGTPLGNWTLLQSLSCDTLAHTSVSVTDSACTIPTVSVNKSTTSTNAVVSVSLPSSPGSEEYSPAASTNKLSVSTSARDDVLPVPTSARYNVYQDQQEIILGNSSWDEDKLSGFVHASISSTTQMAYSQGWDSNKTLINANEDKFSGIVHTSISSTTQMAYSHDWDTNMTVINAEPERSVFTWNVLGAVFFLIISIVFVVIGIRFRRRMGSEYSVPASYCCSFMLFDHTDRTYDYVSEDCQHSHYIAVDECHKGTEPKTEHHYLCRDVTGLEDAAHELPACRLTASTKCRCSRYPETSAETVCATADLEEHVYEVVE
jgi:hypothetical protein